jgi:DNA gyrase/topoisomerase IV subunit A
MQLLADIDEDTVDFVDNYDGEFERAVVLPARFPNLLVNGSQGIAVGMATNIPPHNLGEVIDATVHLLDNPDATPDDLMEFVKGPDFPTGASILGRRASSTPTAPARLVKMRAKAEIEETTRGGRPDRGHRAAVPDESSVDRAKIRSWSTAASSRASPTSTTSPRGQDQPRHHKLKRDAPPTSC